MKTVKYCIIYLNNEDICDIIVEDGGVACVHLNEDGLHLSLYKDRLAGWHHYASSFFDEFGPYNIKIFDKEHLSPHGKISGDVRYYALDWLCMSSNSLPFEEVTMEELFN